MVYLNAKTEIIGKTKIKVFSPEGNLIVDKELPNGLKKDTYTIDLRGFSKGIYFLNVNTSSGNLHKKIVLQ